MSNHQYSFSNTNSNRHDIAMQYQTANPYAALVATAGPEHDGRSCSSDSPPSSGSSASFVGYSGAAVVPATPPKSQAQTYSDAKIARSHVYYGSPGQARYNTTSTIQTPTRNNNSARFIEHGASHSAGRVAASHVPTTVHPVHGPQVSSLTGVPESVAVQEMAFREGQRNSSSSFDNIPANPFAKQFDQLWAAFYKLGTECGGHPASVPANPSRQNFAWPVLINPYTQSLEQPNGSLDPGWTRKMIQVALNCMEELIRITCRRNAGWDKTVADIPLPAQEALLAFPDLAQRYELLKRHAKEARAGGRPYGY